MNSRSSVLVLGAALLSCLALAVCAALGIGGYFVYTGRISVAGLGTTTADNHIVYVGNDKNIHVVNPATNQDIGLTADGGDTHAYNFPTWSPDDSRIAFVSYTFENGAPTEGTLYTVSPRGDKLTPVFKTRENIPFYLYWSPDSQLVGFLSNKDSGNLALRIARADVPDSMQELGSGAPLYWAWSPDSAQVFTHVGGTRTDNNDARLAFLSLQNSSAPQTLDALPGAFQAPQWSPDGKTLFSKREGASQAIAVGDAKGSATTTLANYNGRASFTFSPDGTSVAYVVTDPRLRVPHFGPLQVVNADGTNTRAISKENALAFVWSPDSKKLAYLTVDVSQNQQNQNTAPPPQWASNAPGASFSTMPVAQGAQPRLQFQWKIWDSTTGEIRLAANFVPTESFLTYLPYFDQYASSATFWSPDSQALVYTTQETEGGSVWIADITGKNPIKQIGQGVLAFWSWR